MVTVKKEGIILDKTPLGFENEGVLNPAILQEGDTVHIFYRAVRKGNFSTIGYCRLNGPTEIAERSEFPLLFSELPQESRGLEDPRIVAIDGTYYMTYTAYDTRNALGALAVSTDLKNWEKKGIMVPQITYNEFRYLVESNGRINKKYLRFGVPLVGAKQPKEEMKNLIWDKNVILFPRKIDGKFYFFHRIPPDIQLASVENFEDLTPKYWQDYLLHLPDHIVLQSFYEHESSYLGGGCPPIECEEGWIVIYHGVHDSPTGYIYSACVALLDLNDPMKELSRLPYPLFSPDLDWEMTGYVNNVCFPTGTALFGDTLYIYYGAADEHIACASLSISELISELVAHKKA